MAKTIHDFAVEFGTDKAGGHASTYDAFLSMLRDKPLNILELGINSGASLKMWCEAFPYANIYGWDKDIEKTYDGLPMPKLSWRILIKKFDH